MNNFLSKISSINNLEELFPVCENCLNFKTVWISKNKFIWFCHDCDEYE